jgi:hypothetical protein
MRVSESQRTILQLRDRRHLESRQFLDGAQYVMISGKEPITPATTLGMSTLMTSTPLGELEALPESDTTLETS